MKLKTKTFAISGQFENPTPILKSFVLDNGGMMVSSVVKNTDYLICNGPNGSSKYKKAKALGTTIVGEEDLLSMDNIGLAESYLISIMSDDEGFMSSWINITPETLKALVAVLDVAGVPKHTTACFFEEGSR